jgi:hypothetical protein
MKKILLLLGIYLGAMAVNAQNTDSTVVKSDTVNQIVSTDTTGHKILGDKPEVVEKGDTTHIRLGNKGITIVKKDGTTNVEIHDLEKKKKDKEDKDEDSDEDDSDWDNHDFKYNPFHRSKVDKFEPHWGGLALTLNNFMTRDFSMNLPPESQFMELNAGRSIGVDLNILEYAIPFSKTNGLYTGLGI